MEFRRLLFRSNPGPPTALQPRRATRVSGTAVCRRRAAVRPHRAAVQCAAPGPAGSGRRPADAARLADPGGSPAGRGHRRKLRAAAECRLALNPALATQRKTPRPGPGRFAFASVQAGDQRLVVGTETRTSADRTSVVWGKRVRGRVGLG